jgi:predicted acyltransferase
LSDRRLWLDVLRGIAVAGMILANNPGSREHVYWPLTHAPWHGWTPVDLIFPLFLFIVGISISFAFSDGERSHHGIYVKVLRRTILLFALGVLITALPGFDLSTIRLTGVLQRIAVCYLLAVLVFLVFPRPRVLLLLIAALLVADYALVTFVPVPGCEVGSLSRECNVAGYIDRTMLGRHIGGDHNDPEGLLTTILATATTLCGVLAGQWLQARKNDRDKLLWLATAGLCSLVAGLIGHFWFPINKTLWTSSYVLFTAGVNSLAVAFCYALIHIKQINRWATPFQILGVNALAAFILAELLARIVAADGWWNLPHADGRLGANLRAFVYEHVFIPWVTPELGSGLWALAYLTLVLGIMTVAYRLRIRITR